MPTLQPWHAAKRYPGLRVAHSAARSPPRLMLAGGSLRSPPAPPSAAACRPARGVAAGTVCVTMQGQAAPLARRRCRPCIVPHPVPYRGHGRTSPVGQRARCRSRLVAGPTLVGPGRPALCRALAVRPGPDYITGLFRALAPSAALARTRARLAGALQPAISPLSRAANLGATAPSPPGAAAPQARAHPYLDTLVTTHAQYHAPGRAKNGITKAPVAC